MEKLFSKRLLRLTLTMINGRLDDLERYNTCIKDMI
jgi:hypothetical protein